MIEYRSTATGPDGNWIITPILIDEGYFELFHSSENTPEHEQIYQDGLAQGLITIIGEGQ